MTSDMLINTIILGGITGAGLIFASYSIIIAFSEKMKEFKDKRKKEARDKLKKDKSTDELKKIIEEIETEEATPLYLSQAVYAIFVLYILSSMVGLFYLNSTVPNNQLGTAAVWLFGIATGLFGLMGLSLLQDFLEFMRNIFEIKKGKR